MWRTFRPVFFYQFGQFQGDNKQEMTQPARYYHFKGPRVTLLDVHSLIHQLNAALALPSGEDFTLDMNEVEYLDSLCLSLLLLVRHRLTTASSALVLMGLQDHMASALRLMSIDPKSAAAIS
ncbi:MAG TPA: STAS domain-containing protein [Candidatus Sumerlaeota bacterium]|nr:STAS domain-containing protein [Candidatus Sumerlaeota bacterium]